MQTTGSQPSPPLASSRDLIKCIQQAARQVETAIVIASSEEFWTSGTNHTAYRNSWKKVEVLDLPW